MMETPKKYEKHEKILGFCALSSMMWVMSLFYRVGADPTNQFYSELLGAFALLLFGIIIEEHHRKNLSIKKKIIYMTIFIIAVSIGMTAIYKLVPPI